MKIKYVYSVMTWDKVTNQYVGFMTYSSNKKAVASKKFILDEQLTDRAYINQVQVF